MKSLFNVSDATRFELSADLPIDDDDWRLGIVVGPSGSGKTSIGRTLWGGEALHKGFDWPENEPIIDAIARGGSFNHVTAALSAVGLGSVPSWLRPYSVLSNGEKFRAELARIICERPKRIIVDEFTSVVDRQIARFGSLAFQKSWKRSGGQCVLLSCHYDIIDWLEPDWVFDTATGKWSGRSLWRRPKFELEIFQTDWRYWKMFEPHHYLKLPKMPSSICYVGTVEDELVCHIAVSSCWTGRGVAARACRLVVMPEWQGAGVGLRFLNHVCELQKQGLGKLKGRKVITYFHTSHPGLAAALRRSKPWRQVSGGLHGGNKKRSERSIRKARKKGTKAVAETGYGGHFRAVQGFCYVGGAA